MIHPPMNGCISTQKHLPFFPQKGPPPKCTKQLHSDWLACIPPSVLSQSLHTNLSHFTAFYYIRHQNAMMEQAWQCLIITVYYSPCPLFQHPSFFVHIPSSVAWRMLYTKRKGNREICTTGSEILRRSLRVSGTGQNFRYVESSAMYLGNIHTIFRHTLTEQLRLEGTSVGPLYPLLKQGHLQLHRKKQIQNIIKMDFKNVLTCFLV